MSGLDVREKRNGSFNFQKEASCENSESQTAEFEVSSVFRMCVKSFGLSEWTFSLLDTFKWNPKISVIVKWPEILRSLKV
jgi:hypothetical protein